MRTCPSLLPGAMRWNERPHEGAHDTLVTAYTGSPPEDDVPWAGVEDAAVVRSPEPSWLGGAVRELVREVPVLRRREGAVEEGGDSRERRTSGRRCEESWIIYSYV